MSKEAEWLGDEGVAAILGLVLVKFGDVRLSEELVSLGLPGDSRVAVFWDDEELVIGIRPNNWKPEDK